MRNLPQGYAFRRSSQLYHELTFSQKVLIMDHKTDEERAEMTTLLNRKDELVMEKKQHEAAMLTIKNQIRTKVLPAKQYKQCCEGQAKRIKQINYIEAEIRAIKVRLRQLSDAESQRFAKIKSESKESADIHMQSQGTVHDLLFHVAEIRDDYRRFSADGTRISSMRRNAAEFANRLDELLSRFKEN